MALAFLIPTVLSDRAGFKPDEPTAPASALQAARAAGLNGPVLNNYNFGGFLIFSGVPVFIDGRADLYGDDFIRGYGGLFGGGSAETLRKSLEQYAMQWTIFEPVNGVMRLLDRLPGWE